MAGRLPVVPPHARMAARLGFVMCLLGGGAADGEFSPAFVWSPRDIGVGYNAKHFHEVTDSALEEAVTAISARGKHPLIRPGEFEAPEVQLLFLAEKLSTEHVRAKGAEMRNIEKLLKDSASSLSIPFTTRTSGSPRLFGDDIRVDAHEVDQFFLDHADMFTDRKPNRVVVDLKEAMSPGDIDALVGRVSSLVEAGTSGNYAGLLTGNHEAVPASPPFKGRKLAAGSKAYYLHMTPTLLTAYLMLAILLVIFLSGFCCLFSLQTPRAFPKTKKEEE